MLHWIQIENTVKVNIFIILLHILLTFLKQHENLQKQKSPLCVQSCNSCLINEIDNLVLNVINGKEQLFAEIEKE